MQPLITFYFPCRYGTGRITACPLLPSPGGWWTRQVPLVCPPGSYGNGSSAPAGDAQDLSSSGYHPPGRPPFRRERNACREAAAGEVGVGALDHVPLKRRTAGAENLSRVPLLARLRCFNVYRDYDVVQGQLPCARILRGAGPGDPVSRAVRRSS